MACMMIATASAAFANLAPRTFVFHQRVSTLRMLTDRALQIAQEQVKRRYDGSHLLGGMSTEAEAAHTAFLDAGSRGKDGKSEQAFIVPWGCDVIW